MKENTLKVVTINLGRVLRVTPHRFPTTTTTIIIAASKIAHHQPSSRQTNRSCRPSYIHLSSRRGSTMKEPPADTRTWIKTLLANASIRLWKEGGGRRWGSRHFFAPWCLFLMRPTADNPNARISVHSQKPSKLGGGCCQNVARLFSYFFFLF